MNMGGMAAPHPFCEQETLPNAIGMSCGRLQPQAPVITNWVYNGVRESNW